MKLGYDSKTIQWHEVVKMYKHQHVYISGKISGLPDFNKAKFLAAEKHLNWMGFNQVVNPHDLNHHHHDKSWASYMKACLRRFCSEMQPIGLVIVLDDFRKSHGACIEVFLANKLDIPVFCIDTMCEIKLSTWLKIKLLLNLF
jgi:hypothetical protein